jgi:hypothetical protein
MPAPKLEITNPSQLAGLSVWPWRRAGGTVGVVIHAPDVPESDREAWQKEVNGLLFVCGCDIGALVMTIGLVAYLILLAFHIGPVSLGGRIAAGFGVVVAGVLIGKAIGLARAQSRLRLLIAEIRTRWNGPTPINDEPAPECG